MRLRKWDDIPLEMKTEEVYKYYNHLQKKQVTMLIKRVFDIVLSLFLIIAFAPIFFALAIAIKVDSKGPVFYRQKRVTQYGKVFHIFKFRTMIDNADKCGSNVTIKNDNRITRVGKVIRKYRLDEISQLIDVFRGTMTFVGTRPEVVKFVEQYTPEMKATLLLPAGVTSLASIYYKDEAELLIEAEDADLTYVKEVLPQKMHYNLQYIVNFSLIDDVKIILKTVLTVLGKEFIATENCKNRSGKNEY